MAAPAYTWEFVYDLWGNRTPKVITMEASASLETKVGTLLFMTSGQLDNCTDGTGTMIGLAMEATSAAATAADPIKVALIAPGMVIRGTASADASALTGFASKSQDIDADQRIDIADQTGGFLSVYRIGETDGGVQDPDGLIVDCTVTNFDIGPAA
jgi:hypothetical protein